MEKAVDYHKQHFRQLERNGVLHTEYGDFRDPRDFNPLFLQSSQQTNPDQSLSCIEQALQNNFFIPNQDQVNFVLSLAEKSFEKGLQVINMFLSYREPFISDLFCTQSILQFFIEKMPHPLVIISLTLLSESSVDAAIDVSRVVPISQFGDLLCLDIDQCIILRFIHSFVRYGRQFEEELEYLLCPISKLALATNNETVKVEALALLADATSFINISTINLNIANEMPNETFPILYSRLFFIQQMIKNHSTSVFGEQIVDLLVNCMPRCDSYCAGLASSISVDLISEQVPGIIEKGLVNQLLTFMTRDDLSWDALSQAIDALIWFGRINGASASRLLCENGLINVLGNCLTSLTFTQRNNAIGLIATLIDTEGGKSQIADQIRSNSSFVDSLMEMTEEDSIAGMYSGRILEIIQTAK